jgi:hypothetical protein
VIFRNRLASKFGWLYGYLCYKCSKIDDDLKKLEYEQPKDKILYNVRPSERVKILTEQEHEFNLKKEKIENEYHEVMKKLSTWNTYFGLSQKESQDDHQQTTYETVEYNEAGYYDSQYYDQDQNYANYDHDYNYGSDYDHNVNQSYRSEDYYNKSNENDLIVEDADS